MKKDLIYFLRGLLIIFIILFLGYGLTYSINVLDLLPINISDKSLITQAYFGGVILLIFSTMTFFIYKVVIIIGRDFWYKKSENEN